MTNNNNRPRFLNLLKIYLPVTGLASILHRLSGVVLFVAIPASLYLLQLSVSSQQGYEQAIAYLGLPLVKVSMVFVIWAFLHHLLAGVRFLLIDQNIGVSLAVARNTALLVVSVALILTLVISAGYLL